MSGQYLTEDEIPGSYSVTVRPTGDSPYLRRQFDNFRLELAKPIPGKPSLVSPQLVGELQIVACGNVVGSSFACFWLTFDFFDLPSFE
jgi:hypothetical protein